MNMKRIISWLVPIAALLILTRLAIVVGPDLEHDNFPVLDEVKIESMLQNKESGDIVLMGSFIKKRECEIQRLTASIYTADEIEKNKAKIEILEAGAQGAKPESLPLGFATWGPWIVSPNVKPGKGDKLKIQSIHKCHALYYTKSTLVFVPLDSINKFK